MRPDPLAARPLMIDGVELRVAPLGGFANAPHLAIVKPMDAVEAYRQLLASFDRPKVVELGIAYGGSVALIALVARPATFVAMELSPDRVALLDRLLEERDLTDRVHLHYGVDQADRVTLAAIVDDELGDDPLDLVIDDASHLYDKTVASFEVLFPRLRPGGRYIIEDWSCDHAIRALLAAGLDDPGAPQHDWAQTAVAGGLTSANAGEPAQTAVAVASLHGRPGPPPLSRLAAQLVLSQAGTGSGIASVTVNPFWIDVTRSAEPLPDGFRVDAAYEDPFGMLSPVR